VTSCQGYPRDITSPNDVDHHDEYNFVELQSWKIRLGKALENVACTTWLIYMGKLPAMTFILHYFINHFILQPSLIPDLYQLSYLPSTIQISSCLTTLETPATPQLVSLTLTKPLVLLSVPWAL
jgi:hypothetical protein